jgi:acetyl esterase/lipase
MDERENASPNQSKREKMKILPAIIVGLLAYFAAGVSTGRGQPMYSLEPTAIPAGTPPPGVIETYKVVNGMSIQTTVFNIDDSRTHRVVIVIHGGGYSAGGVETTLPRSFLCMDSWA